MTPGDIRACWAAEVGLPVGFGAAGSEGLQQGLCGVLDGVWLCTSGYIWPCFPKRLSSSVFIQPG